MKAGFLIAVLLIYNLLNAQTTFDKQFRNIINDTANGFPNHRAEVKKVIKADRMIEYFTTTCLDSTSVNKILYVGGGLGSTYGYVALLKDSVRQNEARSICDRWKDKITSLMGSNFEMKKYEVGNGYSWNFKKNYLGISIDLDGIENTDLHRVSLFISYTSFSPDKVR
jgi:hypothetical protein